LAIRSLPSQRYPLKEGDTFRIGTLRVKVKEIILEDNQPEKPIEVNSKYAIYENLTK
jgi:pSer/pThr/pTyr-binding forkhead associated (FHA) protein